MDPPNLLYIIPANITSCLSFSHVRQRTESGYCDFLNLLTKMWLSHISVRLAPFSIFYTSCQKICWPQVFISNKAEEYHNFNRQIKLEWPSFLMQIRRSGSPPTAKGREGNCNLNRRGKLTIQKRIPFANDVYFSMVDNTLNIRQISTNMNL